jgi:LmbE family N-acetylglucosaminyl deacetylase
MTAPTILGFFAHPDDEIMCGGALARHAAEGARVVIVCGTRGENGEISEPHLATPENIAEVRTEELRAAAALLGITDVRFLGFRDSGMVGTPENEDPRSLHRADPAEAQRRIVALIREVQPTVVVTHDPTGGYGHPDHIALCTHVTAAYDMAGDPAVFPAEGPAWQPERLYYGVMARSFFDRIREAMRAAQVDTAPFERPGWENLGYPDEDVALSVDVSSWIEAKRLAFDAHRTQFGPDSPMRRMPPEVMSEMNAREHFVIARPAGLVVAREGGLIG